jgi:hypothetical protein
MPFVQGHLRNESLTVTISTSCEQSSRPIEIAIDTDLSFRVVEGEDPVIFVPLVDFEEVEDPSITDVF